jgi:hypothetical protein
LLLSRQQGTRISQTSALGIFYDYTYKGHGLKIQEIIEDGPLDKATSKIKAGRYYRKEDGDAITNTVDHYKYLNRKANSSRCFPYMTLSSKQTLG